MKRIIAILLGISLLAAPTLRAQQYNEGPENDLNFSYGYFTVSQFATVLGGVFGAAFTLGYASPSSIRSTGSLQLEYLHKTNTWLWLGGGIQGEGNTLVMDSKDSEGNTTNSQSTDIITGSVFATAKANWLRREKLALYSRLSAGLFVSFDTDDTGLAPSIQISPIGFEAGGLQWRGFVELGVGMHGILVGGVRYLF